MSEDIAPEADRLDGVPHPRETERLFGQEAAEKALLDAIETGRLHHAWLLTGPKGIGKATLAWRAARCKAQPSPCGMISGPPVMRGSGAAFGR